MAERGRIGWQKATGYGRRNQAEMAMARYKHLIGPKLRSRSLPAQQGEVAIAVAVLNTMIPGEARLRPGRLDGAREGPAQPHAGPCNNVTRHKE